MLSEIKKLYSLIPYEKLGFLKNIPDKFLYGSSYLKTNVSSSKDIIEDNLLQTLIYARKFTEYGKDHIPEKIIKADVYRILADLPIISSTEISDNLKYFTSSEYSTLNSFNATTGGTGRNPTSLIFSNDSFGIEWKHIHHIWSYLNYNKKKHAKLTLRGLSLPQNKLISYNPVYNEIVVDTFKMRENNILDLLIFQSKYSVKYLHGYPSLVKEYMNYCKSKGYEIHYDGIFLGSEGSSINERKDMSDFFKCKVITWYGQSEKIILAYDKNMIDSYLVLTSYGYPSILNPDKNGFGEIVGTSFINRALPLINYKTGDYGRIYEDANNLFLSNIKGRWGKDFIYLNNNKRIPSTSINLHSGIQDEILFYQIIQKEFGQLDIKILPKKTTKLTGGELMDEFRKNIETKLIDFKINYEIVNEENEIQRSKRGKMIMLVQYLKINGE